MRPGCRRRPKKRGGVIALAVGGGVLALLLVVGLVIFAVKSGGTPGGGGSPTPNPLVGGASPACGYKLAYLGVLTGDNSADGIMIRDSAKMAVDQYNTKHAGCTVSLAEFDTQRKDDLSATVAQQAVDDTKILGVVGPVYRSEVLAAGPILEQAGMPLISPAASDEELSRKGWKVFHRLLGTDADQAVAGAQYLKTIAKASKTYIVYDDTEFGSTASAEVRRRLGDLVVGEVAITRTATDFTAAVKQVTDAGADSVYFAGFFDDGGIFVKQLKTANSKITVVSGDKIFTQSFVDAAGAGAEGTIITCPCIPADQAGQNFASNYKQKFSETASYYGPESFDAANIFLAGLNAGKSTRADMLAYVNAYSGRGHLAGHQVHRQRRSGREEPADLGVQGAGRLRGQRPGHPAGLAGDLGDPGLADDGDADLARVGQLLLDLLGHVAGQHGRADVVDVVRAHHDPDLAAGLHREDLLDAGLAGRRSPRCARAA